MRTRMFERLVGAAVRRPALTVAIVLALALAGGALATGLKPNAASDTFVSRSSSSFKATEDDYRHFGGDPVVILIRESLPNLVETSDLGRLIQLEACLAGQTVVPNEQLHEFVVAPANRQKPFGGPNSPCGKLMKTKPVQVVYGPGTFLDRAVVAVNAQMQAAFTQLEQSVKNAERAGYEYSIGRGLSRTQALKIADDAGQLEYQKQVDELATAALNTGITSRPRIDDLDFIRQVVFDPTRGTDQPKARFAYLFPTANSALIQVRLKASLTQAQQEQAIGWIRQAVRMPAFKSTYGGTYTVTGEPVVAGDLASELTGATARLLIVALLVMAATLLIVFRSRRRLLPLALALAAAGITFGAMAIVGASLTIASIAVVPILIGLGVDYAIQFQSRAAQARQATEREGLGAREAVIRAARTGAPTIATAALATSLGFLVLLLSPVPMVRGFGVLLVVGIAVALACTLTAGSAAIILGTRSGRRARGEGLVAASLRGAGEILRPARRRAATLLSLRPVRRRMAHARSRSGNALGWVLARSQGTPQRLIAVGVVLAALGWVADTQTGVQSDVTKLVPPNLPALRNLHTLERVTGVSGEIDVLVRAKNVASPSTIDWMIRYESALLAHYGYVEAKGCARATLCPALSLPDLFSRGQGRGRGSAPLTTASVQGLLHAVPPYFSQAVITPDQREATLAFGIRLMPLSRQLHVVDYMASQLHPPPGVTAQLAGLPVLAAQANGALSSSPRRLLTLLAGLIVVGLALLAVFRNVTRALIPLVPIVLATGWSALILFLIGIPLNPMSATLGALVIAISTEFSVLLAERFRQERRDGHAPAEALARTYRLTGLPVLASGLTAIAGFGVLVVSNITMLRDFGFVTLIDLSVSLAGVLVVLPAVLALSERAELRQSTTATLRRLASRLRRPRRRARVA